jgi:hypothetical protein
MAYTTIDDPEAYFQVKLWTGTGGSLSPTFDGDTDLQPDLIWLKDRDDTYNHFLFDSVRGALKEVRSNTTAAEATLANSVSAFNSDGFTLGTDANTNASGDKFVAWCWKAGTSFSNDASSTSVGSLDSAGSVSTDAGFSIISYTGAGDGQASSTQTVAHGLGVVPQVLIVKNLADATNWFVYHHKNTSTPATDVLYLNLTNATGDDNGPWNDVAPTSSVFTVGGDNGTNGNGDGMIAYCFAEKQGYSKFGSYTGNGNADGTFVYTGFKPAMVICKKSSAAGTNWGIIDNKRANSFNQISAMLNPNSNGTEGANNNCDFVSNGFKWRTNDGNSNASATYIYMAFAENPFVTSTGIPATAR